MTMTLIEQLLSETKSGKKELLRADLIVSVTEQIWAAMNAAGMTKADLARALETSKANVTQLLGGQRNMTLATLADICEAVGAKPQVTLARKEATKQAQIVLCQGVGKSSAMASNTKPAIIVAGIGDAIHVAHAKHAVPAAPVGFRSTTLAFG